MEPQPKPPSCGFDDMQKKVTAILTMLLTSTCFGAFIVYEDTFAEFVEKRDIVIRGVVVEVKDIEQEGGIRKTQEDPALPDQLAIIKILEVLKNERNLKTIRKDEKIELIVPSTKETYRLAGIPYHDPGTEGFWILSSKAKNYGMNTERALRLMNSEEEVRKALK